MLPYIPSPIEFEYDSVYRAIVNKSGRMQYYKIDKGRGRKRISRSEFSRMYNNSNIIAIRPIQDDSPLSPIQMDIYVKSKDPR